jgi:hypothetical protein
VPGRDPDSGHEVAAGIEVYRNNLRAGFLRALSLEFPVIERLVGADYFRQLAWDFQRRHPSRAGDLHEIGAPFADYLRSRFGEGGFAYLPDVAALEWACQQSAVAAAAQDFDAAAISCVAPEAYSRLRFELKPECLLVRSDYPILRIWQSNQPGALDETIDLSMGGECVVTHRGRDGVELCRITEGMHSLLKEFSSGSALEQAWAAAVRCDPGFDLGQALRQALALRLLAAVDGINPARRPARAAIRRERRRPRSLHEH